MSKDQSPDYWQELQYMDADTLRAAFNVCARQNLTWAVDQAKCLSRVTDPESPKGRVLQAFCEHAAGQALERGNVPAALVAMKMASENAGGDIDPLLDQIKGGLNKRAAKDRDQAVGLALMIKAQNADNKAIMTAVAEFMIDHIAEDTQGMLMSLARDSGSFSAKAQDALVEKIILFMEKTPSEARGAAQIMLDKAMLSSPQVKALTILLQDRAAQPALILEELRRAETEQEESPAGKPLFITPKPGQVH
ncbi:MAG: hypothetical protein H6867_00900 [Rhodospirillales bacterium]|nr:hypothetical protein [Rhodospirillales bacterium]MCB9996783.1 hypothetical protein [Rhodospirillales bacterium]